MDEKEHKNMGLELLAKLPLYYSVSNNIYVSKVQQPISELAQS